MDLEDFKAEDVPETVSGLYQYLRKMERIVDAVYEIMDDRFQVADEEKGIPDLRESIKNLKSESFRMEEGSLRSNVINLKHLLTDVLKREPIDEVDLDYKMKETFESFESQCRKLRDATLNKAFMEQFRELDNKQIHQAKVVPKDERLKLTKALFSCGTHCVIQREKERLDPVVEERVLKLLTDLQEDRRSPQEVFKDVREMFLLTARPERKVEG